MDISGMKVEEVTRQVRYIALKEKNNAKHPYRKKK